MALINAFLAGSLLTLFFPLPSLPAGWEGHSNGAASDDIAIKVTLLVKYISQDVTLFLDSRNCPQTVIIDGVTT